MKNIKYVFIMILCMTLLVGCSKEEESKQNESNPNKTEPDVDIKTDGEKYQSTMPAAEADIIANLDIKFEKAKNGDYVMFITNNNTFVIPDIEISVNFYENDSLVDNDKDGHDAILPGYTVVSFFESYESFDKADYDISVEWSNSYENHSDNVKIDYNLNSSNDCLVTVKNNSDVEIDEIEIIAVFYDKDGNLLGTSYSQDITDVGVGKSETEKLYLRNRGSGIDKVDIYINQAHTFGL